MRLTLRIISGPLAGTEVVAETNKSVSVGRTKKSDLATEDNFMSSRHFAVECGAEACFVRDLGSRNGTTLNGKTITEMAALKDGDKIAAGHSEFLVKIESKPVVSELDRRMMDTLRPPKPTPPPEVQPKPEIAKPPDPVQPKTASDSGMFSRTADKSEAGLAEGSASKPRSVNERPQKMESIPPAVVAPPPPPPPPPKPDVPKPDLPRVDVRTPDVPRVDVSKPDLPKPPVRRAPPVVLDAYTAATPEGRLLQLLSSQREPLLGLLDATHDPKVLELLRNSGEEYRSIYQDEKNAAVAPYLVSLPPHSPFLKRLIHDGWGKGWGVYLTCSVSLRELRQYFRQALMVALPDGMELFSRFYAPAYFRHFLETGTRAEVERFFGPITAYFMEAEKPEILLEFTRSNQGVEKRGHLLSDLE